MRVSTPAAEFHGAELELPEEINLQLQVANVGSRTLAILADLALCGLILFVVYAATFLVGHDVATDWLTRTGSGVLQIFLLLLIFGFQWVYFSVFEWLWNGQTPGKRLLHLRVIKSDGSPISGIDVMLRNVTRPIDTFGPMGLLGLVLIFINRRGQRLGDFLAGTLVIHETPIDWSFFDQLEASAKADEATTRAPSIRLTPEQWELLHRYIGRRAQLAPEVRASLAASLHAQLRAAARGTDLERSLLEPDAWLSELAQRT